MNRREFSSLIALGGALPTFLGRTALSTALADQPGGRDTILVVVQLTGGNDGLNTVIPIKDPAYARLRPNLKQAPNQVRKINDDLAFHPSLTGFSTLLEDNALCVVQGVGYPNPSQSHFRSMDIWQAGSTERDLAEGWIGKALRSVPGANSFHLSGANEPSPLALTGAPVRVPSIRSLEDYQLRLEASSGSDRRAQQSFIESAAAPAGSEPSLLDFVQRTATSTLASSRRLREIGRSYQPRVPYPNTSLANHLKLAAQLIDAGIGARLFYVTIDGFDTHAGQAGAHANLLREVGDAISAFYRDLKARGQQDRLLIATFSEFGRRAAENGSLGTDHGSGAPMFLVGGRVQAGPIGAHPSLTDLEQGNLKHHTDFRQVYATILDRWLGVSSRQILGRDFEALNLLRG